MASRGLRACSQRLAPGRDYRRRAGVWRRVGKNIGRRHRITEQIKEYLLTHAGSSLTLEGVAQHLRLSAEHIARVFKREESMTVFDYLRELRIERSKTLLASSSLAVHAIAREAGYSSATLFRRKFKQVTGMTPTRYRQEGGGRHSFSGSTMQ